VSTPRIDLGPLRDAVLQCANFTKAARWLNHRRRIMRKDLLARFSLQ
jgi:hypothetical protein